MRLEEFEETFEKYNSDYLKDDELISRMSQRLDVNAILLLDSLVPGNSEIISWVNHDVIYFNVDIEKIASVVTEDQIRDLIRCGIMYNKDENYLFMFV